MSEGIFVFLETTETTVALSGAVYKLCDSRSSENAARGFSSAKKTYKKILKIFLSLLLSLPCRLRSEKFLQTRLFFKSFFSQISHFLSFFFTSKEKKTLRALRRRNIHTCFHLLIDGSEREKQGKKENSPEIWRNAAKKRKMKMVFRVSRERKRTSGQEEYFHSCYCN